MKEKRFVAYVIADKYIERALVLEDILCKIVGKITFMPNLINTRYQDLLDSNVLISTVPNPRAFEALQGQFLRTKKFILITDGTEREMQDAEDFAKKYPKYLCIGAPDLTNQTKIPKIVESLRLLIYS